MYPNEWTPAKPKKEPAKLTMMFPSKRTKRLAKERAEYLDISLSKYISWLVERDLKKDPRKQYERIHKSIE